MVLSLNGDVREINRQNLATLQKCDAKEVYCTQLAQECFKQITESQLGLRYYAKKYAITGLSFFGALSAPVVAGAQAVLQMAPAISVATGVAASLGGIAAIDRAANALVGRSPAAALFSKVHDLTLGAYKTYENDRKHEQEELLDKMTADIKSAYDGMAQELQSLFDEAKANPAAIIELKDVAHAVSCNLPKAMESFFKIGLQNRAEEITQKLVEAIARIETYTLQFTDDAAYNTALLISRAPLQLPQEAITLLKKAEAHTLSKAHVAAKLATATASALLGLGSYYVAGSALASSFGSLACAAVGHLYFSQKEQRYNVTASESRQKAESAVQNIFDGIAKHLVAQHQKAPKKLRQQLTADAKILQAKIPQIHAALAGNGFAIDATKKLEGSLETITTIRKSTRLRGQHG